MPRIPEEAIARTKSDTDLVALVQSRGVALKKQGANWTGLCPFHNDRDTPNLIVTPGKGLFRCMASGCGKSGNAIQFVEMFDGVSFRHAFELLSGGGAAAFQQTNNGTPAKVNTVPKLPCPLEVPDTDAADEAKLLGQVADFYHERLAHSQAAREYLAARGLDDDGILKRFKVGVGDRTLGLRLPKKNRVTGEKLRTALIKLGVYRTSGHEHLNGCLVVPVADAVTGDIRQLYGRRLEARAPKDKRHLYLARPLAGIFNPQALESREIILCESILDAMSFARHGMDSATCTFGTSNFTAELFEAIKTAKIESVRLAFDADNAGDAAASAAAQRLQSIGIECHRVRLPLGSDVNSYMLDQGGDALRKALKSAEWLGAGKIPNKSSKSQKPSVQVPSSLAAKSLAAKKEEPARAVVGLPAVALVEVGDHHEFKPGERTYRIGGLARNNATETLKITLRLSEPTGLIHADAIDLYRDSDRRKFTERAAEECRLERELIKRDLGKLLLACEQKQEERLAAPVADSEEAPMDPEAKARALELLKSPNLIAKLLECFARAGTVGEDTNKVAAYLAATSRLLDKPLAIIIQSTSAAGKSTLMEAVLAFFPKEEQVKYSAMTGQSLYYLGESNLKHKILAIVEEEGAEKASYALKLLQSEGELTIASTGKDPQSGRMETQTYHVEGPAAIMLTTTSIDIDEELMNRCLILTVDESREQTERIHALQRTARTLEGLRLKRERETVYALVRDAQKLLKPIAIVNEFADELTFTAGRTRTRRDHEKYLTLIETITLLHQHQRKIETDPLAGPHIKTTLADIEAANQIAPEVLGRALDELPPQTRRMFEEIKDLIRKQMSARHAEQHLCLFSRRELREATGWSETQTRHHLQKLEDLEYVSRRTTGNGTTNRYELLTDASEPEELTKVGLTTISNLRKQLKKKKGAAA